MEEIYYYIVTETYHYHKINVGMCKTLKDAFNCILECKKEKCNRLYQYEISEWTYESPFRNQELYPFNLKWAQIEFE